MSSTAADSLAKRLALLNERIQRACVDSGRSLEEITLIGVSKTKPRWSLTEDGRRKMEAIYSVPVSCPRLSLMNSWRRTES